MTNNRSTGLRNPYNASRPGHLFVGHEGLRERVIDGLANGRSFAISGGRRCGKTSLLMKLSEELRASGNRGVTFLPRLLDMQEEVPHTVAEFFAAFARQLVQGTDIAVWSPSAELPQAYGDFLRWAQKASSQLAAVHGPDWTVVFLVDELEVAAQRLPNDECFHNLRHWLMRSPLSERVRVVVTGVGQLSQLIGKGSPLNNLEPESLGALAPGEAKALVAHGFGTALPADTENRLLALTGGHPWILQGVLGHLWDERDDLTADAIASAVARFVRNRDDVFVSWLKSFGNAGEAAYACVARAASPVGFADLRRALPKPGPSDATTTVDGVLRVLGYHGVVAETPDGRVQANGSIFRDWFVQNRAYVADEPPPASPVSASGRPAAGPAPKNRRVFIVFGRDRKLHASVVRFLRALRLEPVEWSAALEATRNGSPSVKDILDKAFEMAQAVVVLLTPDDEARLRPVFHGPHEPAHETTPTPQPRPNVIFEAGFAMARFPKSTILVRFDRTTRLFSDIGGVFLLDLGNDFDERQDFVRRLRTCGLDVDDSGTAWQSPEAGGGDFTPAQ